MSRRPHLLDHEECVGAVTPMETRRRAAGRRRLLIGAASAAAHLMVLLALFPARTDPPPAESEPVSVSLLPPPGPAAAPPTPAGSAPARQTSRQAPQSHDEARPTRLPPKRAVLSARTEPPEPVAPALTEAQLAAATTAGSSAGSGQGSGVGGGGACDMVRRLQNALRRDALVQAAVLGADRGKAFLVWNGDWVKTSGEEGKGLAAVREAILWEIGFSPPACRAESVHGLVLLSLRDGPGAARLAMGGGDWRWSDVLGLRR